MSDEQLKNALNFLLAGTAGNDPMDELYLTRAQVMVAVDAIRRLTKDKDDLKAALRPFAEIGRLDTTSDRSLIDAIGGLTLTYFRRAAAALPLEESK